MSLVGYSRAKKNKGQKPYFRDVWCLGTSKTGYPGSFPQDLVNKVRRRWWGQKRLWMFAGVFRDPGHTTVDIKPDLKPTVVANCEDLPFPDASFDFVFVDPPYSAEESDRLYGLPYCSIPKVLNEMARVCRPGGYCLFSHRLIPLRHPSFSSQFKRLEIVATVGVWTLGGFSNIRALTVWRKTESLVDRGVEVCV